MSAFSSQPPLAVSSVCISMDQNQSSGVITEGSLEAKEEDGEEGEGAGAFAAVAAAHGGGDGEGCYSEVDGDGSSATSDTPKIALHGDWRHRNVTQPGLSLQSRRAVRTEVAPDRREHWMKVAARDGQANFGWFVCNYGSLPQSRTDPKTHNIMLQAKTQPAALIALCECTQELEEELMAEGCEDKPQRRKAAEQLEDPTSWGQEVLECRPRHKYITARGDEPKSLLIGIREHLCDELKVVGFWRLEVGKYKPRVRSGGQKGGPRKIKAYARIMVAEVTLTYPVSFLGLSHRVMLVHMHNELARGAFGPDKLKRWWDDLAHRIRTTEVRILLGDFNMSLFTVVPELRSRGICIDVCAWYAWKEEILGTPGADSLGIFAINCPGEFTRVYDIDRVHADSHEGILSSAPARMSPHFDKYPWQTAPGQLLQHFLPKQMDRTDLLRDFLMESDESAEVLHARDRRKAAKGKEKGKASLNSAVAERWFVFKEKN